MRGSRIVALLALCLAAAGLAPGGELPEDRGAAGIAQALARLRTTASALHVTAHPDDEDAGALCLLSRGQGARTMLLSLTRGEGGANLISSNFFDELGVLRTLEHLAACERYGCELYYTRAADYGFSKTMEEALRSWGGEEEILRDAVRAIRSLRPDVVFARFRGDARDGHGHHMLSGVIARKAFEAAADPARFPEQIAEGLRPWAAKKLYHGNLNPDFRPEDRELVTLNVDPGTYDPVLGRSYHQIAREGYSYHRSQGMMSPPSTGGPRPSRYRLVESRLPGPRPAKEESFFEGIDTSIGGLAKLAGEKPPAGLAAGLREMERRVEEAVAAFDARAPEKTLEPLSRGYLSLLFCMTYAGGSPELRAHLERKAFEFQRAFTLAVGLEVDARVKTGRGEPAGGRFDHAIPGQKFTAQITVTNRGKVPIRAFAAGIVSPGDEVRPPEEIRWKTLGPNESLKEDQQLAVRPDAPPTRPHWSRGSIEEHLYHWADPTLATRPLPAEPFRAMVLVTVPIPGETAHEGHFSISEPLRVAVEEPKRGVRLDVLTIVPAIGVRFASAYGVVPAGRREYRLPVLVHSNEKGPAHGTVRLKLPVGWRSEPESREFAFAKENEEGSSEFTLYLPEGAAAEPAAIEAVASYAGKEYAEGYVTVTVPEVGRFNHYRPARHLVRVVEVTVPEGLRLAYVMGSGDEVPAALEALGARVEMLGPAELGKQDLSGYDAVVVGVRAYAVRPDLKTSNARLLEYVKAGGVLLVQYQTPEFDQDFGPYPYSLTSNPEEVSEEDSAVTILAPEHPLFRAPNRITPKDFDGWVEERGSKFWKTWDERYTPLLECHDRGQDPQRGGLLFATYGKGSYIYCAYAFYRQLPHGVPGAIRLWANLISLGRNKSDSIFRSPPWFRVAGMGHRISPMLSSTAYLLFALLPAAAGAEPWEAPPFTARPEEMLRAADSVPAPEGANAVVLLEEANYSFDDAGRSTYRWRAVVRILTPAGLEGWSSLESDWSPWTEEKPSLRARVITRDRSEHPLDPGTIVEAPAGDYSSEIYSDRRVLRAPLPALEPGALVEEEIVLREKSLVFDAGMSGDVQFGGEDPALRVRLVIEAPAALSIRHVARLLPALKMSRSESGGRVRLTFESGPLGPVAEPEPCLPSEVPRLPVVSFSTGRSWKEVAARYREIVDGQIRSADLQELAREASGGAEGREAIVKRCLDRIHREVRYIAMELGESSIVPTRPAETLKRRYGDCKDQAALLIALLRALDIPARAALILSGPGPDLEPELPGLDWFDHVIVQLPGNPEVWIDPTDRYSRPGELPLADQGRLALVADPSTGGLVRTPESTSSDNRLVESREFFLAETGPARIVERTETKGFFESEYRFTYHESDRKELGKSLEKYARSTYLSKKLTRFETSDPLDLSTPFWLRLEASGERGTTDGDEATVALFPSKLTAQLPSALTGESEEDEQDEEGQTEEDSKSRPAVDAAPEAAKRRAGDFEIPEPYLAEWRYRIVPPPGFTLREIPESGEIALGPARLRKKFAVEEGAVTARLEFDTVKRRLNPQEFEALREAIRDLKEKEPVVLRFEQVGEAHLRAGRIREALEEFRKLAVLHPAEALHQEQLSRALLEGGLGDLAREAARRAIDLEPSSAVGQKALAWSLEHDLLGRRFRKGWDRAGALAAYRKAKELDPSDTEARGGLAVLLDHDAGGTRYGSGADVAQAIEEYQALRKDLKATAYDGNLLLALLRTRRFEELKRLAPSLEKSEAREAVLIAAAAASEGAAAGLKEAAKRLSDSDERREALKAASGLLVFLRHYPEAAALLSGAPRASKKAAGLQSEIDLLKKVRRHEEQALTGEDPLSAVKELAVSALRGNGGPEVPLLFRKLRGARSLRAWKLAEGEISQAAATLESLPPDVIADLGLASLEFTVQGDDSWGYRVRMRTPAAISGLEEAWFLARIGGKWVVRATGRNPDTLGEEALRRLESGDAAAAGKWLDWAREEIGEPPADDPFGGNPFLRFWSRGTAAEAERLRVAAALLAGGQALEKAIPLLLKGRESAGSEREKSDFDLALAWAYHPEERATDLLEVAERMAAAQPTSAAAFQFRFRALWKLGRLDALREAAGERLRRLSGNRAALNVLSALAARRGDLEEAEKFRRAIVDAGRAEAMDWIAIAWLGLLRGHSGDAEIEAARRAVDLSGLKEPEVLHTLAALYADSGRMAEARETIFEAMEARESDDPEPGDWYVLGRIAEELGEKDWAAAAYRKVPKPEEEWQAATSTWSLARKRLEGLGGK